MDAQPVGPSSDGQIVSRPEPAIRVAALHALEYCERLFYLEEVEEIRIADERVYAGRTLHIGLAEEESEEHLNIELSDEDLGIAGRQPRVLIV
jgi:CRISP-associated protein Cas1